MSCGTPASDLGCGSDAPSFIRGDLEPARSSGWTGARRRRLPPRALVDLHLLSFSSGAAGTRRAANLCRVPLTSDWRRPGRGSYLLRAQERNAGGRTASWRPGTTERRVPARRGRPGGAICSACCAGRCMRCSSRGSGQCSWRSWSIRVRWILASSRNAICTILSTPGVSCGRLVPLRGIQTMTVRGAHERLASTG